MHAQKPHERTILSGPTIHKRTIVAAQQTTDCWRYLPPSYVTRTDPKQHFTDISLRINCQVECQTTCAHDVITRSYINELLRLRRRERLERVVLAGELARHARQRLADHVLHLAALRAAHGRRQRQAAQTPPSAHATRLDVALVEHTAADLSNTTQPAMPGPCSGHKTTFCSCVVSFFILFKK